MCGIAGIVNLKGKEHSGLQMLQAQTHRGPDATGEWQDEQLWMGHNRLSIIDLSVAANQPMHSHCNRYVIVFNGEIYNYRELAIQYGSQLQLATHSDTEVLLELYALKGSQILNELTGMFAFAIWDKQEQTLFAARDRFGVKPFYYTQKDGGFLFASEIKSIRAAGIPLQPNEAAWAGYFSQGTYGTVAESFWQQVHQLPAGNYLTYSPANSTLHIQKWYHFNTQVETWNQVPEAEKMEQYKQLLTQAVALRFRSDVPVGVSVSGGLDSSLLLATIAQTQDAQSSLMAYTFYSKDEAYSELPWVNALLHQYKMFVQDAVLFDWQQVPELAEKMAAQQDEPFGGFPTLAYANIFAKARQAGVIVLLDGQGIDEAWAGYDYYWNNSNNLVQGSKSAPTQAAVLNPAFAHLATPLLQEQLFSTRLQNLQYRDLFQTKLPRALRFNDRASMLHSVELREPFLDHRLVEMAFGMPEEMKYGNGLPKWELRKLAEQWMQQKISLAPKRPVQTPQREWLQHELKDWAHAQISWLAGAGNPGWFQQHKMMEAWEQYVRGGSDNSFYVWQWINTSLLLQSARQA